MKHINGASLFLTIVSAAGVIATSALAANGATKAAKLLEKAERDKGERLTKTEIIKTAAPAYIPAIVAGASTIACIFGIDSLGKREQAALASSYALLDRSYKEYRRKVQAIYGEEADSRVKEEMAKDEYVEEVVPEDIEGEQLFYDFNTNRYFTATMDQVLQKATMPDGLECYIVSTPFDVPASCWR